MVYRLSSIAAFPSSRVLRQDQPDGRVAVREDAARGGARASSAGRGGIAVAEVHVADRLEDVLQRRLRIAARDASARARTTSPRPPRAAGTPAPAAADSRRRACRNAACRRASRRGSARWRSRPRRRAAPLRGGGGDLRQRRRAGHRDQRRRARAERELHAGPERPQPRAELAEQAHLAVRAALPALEQETELPEQHPRKPVRAGRAAARSPLRGAARSRGSR